MFLFSFSAWAMPFYEVHVRVFVGDLLGGFYGAGFLSALMSSRYLPPSSLLSLSLSLSPFSSPFVVSPFTRTQPHIGARSFRWRKTSTETGEGVFFLIAVAPWFESKFVGCINGKPRFA
jgi:hypothetical protein